jgi:hypothetical protein
MSFTAAHILDNSPFAFLIAEARPVMAAVGRAGRRGGSGL